MDERGVEVWSGRANPWECDLSGHMNARFHVAKSLEGMAGLAAELGMAGAFSPAAPSTLLVREQHIRLLRSAMPGMGLFITATVTAIGESDAQVLLVLRHLSGEPASSFHTTVEHVTAREGRAFPWPARVLDRARALMAEVPDWAAPRSLELAPPSPDAGLEAATRLGLVRTAIGVVGAAECDAFGRMRGELLVGRVSDGLPRLREHGGAEPASEAQGRRMGGAALEYRLIHHAWPKAGDRMAIYGGLAEVDGRTRRLVHWALDPDSGRVWGASDAVRASLDLDTRKIITLSPEALAAAQELVKPGLAP